ncbi:hypothetical protein ACFL1Q_01045 [Patescibacteria group bacterium]
MSKESIFELFGFRREPKPLRISIGPFSVKVDRRVYEKIRLIYPYQNTEFNLSLARESGIKPISLKEIVDQVGLPNLSKTVLFDTPPDGFTPGNHWRTLEVNKEQETAVIQLCGIFGSHDYDLVPPIKISSTTALFTGVSLMQYELGNLPATLREVVETTSKLTAPDDPLWESLKLKDETILWSNSSGTLVKPGKHPLFKSKN